MSRDERTYSGVSKKFDDWVELESNRPTRAHLRRVDPTEPYDPRGESDMTRTIHTLIGTGIGVFLLGLAFYAFSVAAFWGGNGRGGAQVGYTVVGVFLLIAGIGGIIATVNHNFRVLVNKPSRH